MYKFIMVAYKEEDSIYNGRIICYFDNKEEVDDFIKNATRYEYYKNKGYKMYVYSLEVL